LLDTKNGNRSYISILAPRGTSIIDTSTAMPIASSVRLIASIESQRVSAQAEARHSNRNYIPRRQEAFPGLGTPTFRLNYGKRQIDYYRNGLIFEAITWSA
jgi:hypothetical protein